MPKSRRNRVVPLTVVKKKDKAWKGQKIEEVRSALDKYKNVFVFSVKNLRTDKMQKVREDWKGSRFFMGKNSVIQVAFGKTESSEYKDGLAKVSDQLKGHRGILFTDHSRTEVMKYFRNFSSPGFAKTGDIARETIKLDAGPLEMFNFSMEKRLRELGLDVTLKKGVVELAGDFTVCEKGKPLTSESARLLQLLNIEMTQFKVKMEGMWSQGEGYVDFAEEAKLASKIKKPVKEIVNETKAMKSRVKSKTVAAATPLRRSTRKKKIVEEPVDEVMAEDEEEPEMMLN